jgi:hypothetical protein
MGFPSSTNHFGRTLSLGTVSAIVLSLMVALAMILSRCDRSFDITDEGFYLVNAQDPGKYTVSVFHFGFYTGAVFRLVGENIVSFRMAGVALLLLAATWFAIGFDRVLVTVRPEITPDQRFACAALIPASSLFYYSWLGGILTPSYNWLNLAALLLVFGGLFQAFYLNSERDANLQHMFAAAVTGAGTVLAFFAKPTTAAGVFAISLAFVARDLWRSNSTRQKLVLRFIPTAFASGVVLLLVHFVFYEPPKAMLSDYIQGIYAIGLSQTGHSVSDSVGNIFWAVVHLPEGLSDTVSFKASLCVAILASAAIGIRIRPGILGQRDVDRLSAILDALVCAMLIVLSASFAKNVVVLCSDAGYRAGGWVMYTEKVLFLFSGYLGTFAFTLFGLALFVSLLTVRLESAAPSRDETPVVNRGRSYLAVISLFAAPLIYCWGTNNPVVSQSAGALVFLVAGASLLLHSTRLRHGLPLYGLVFSLTICLLLVGSLYVASIAPYRLNAPIREQTDATGIGRRPTFIKLDRNEGEFFRAFRSAAIKSGFRSGDVVIELTGQSPGVVFALGGRPAGCASLASGYAGSQDFAEYYLGSLPDAERRSAWILIAPHDTTGISQGLLKALGLNFPADYELAASAEWPVRKQEIQLWRPRMRNPFIPR